MTHERQNDVPAVVMVAIARHLEDSASESFEQQAAQAGTENAEKTIDRCQGMAGGGKDEVEEDAAFSGIEKLQSDNELEIMGPRWQMVMAFLAVQTQWRYDSSGLICGSHYASVTVTIKELGIDPRTLFSEFQAMDTAVLSQQSAEHFE